MKTTKRWIAFLLVAVMAVACYAVSASADATAKITATVKAGSVKIPADLSKLVDGNRATDATAFDNANLLGFENTGFNHTDGVDAAVEATVEFVVDLGEKKDLAGVYMDVFKDSQSMIAVPEFSFEVSADGKNWYNVTSIQKCYAADGTETAVDALAEKTTVTLASDKTRLSVKARYIKATATFKNGWIFVSEIGYISTTDSGAKISALELDNAYDYIDGEEEPSGSSIGIYTEAKNYPLNEVGYFKNSQATVAEYDAAKKAYKIIFNETNIWTEDVKGHETESVDLKDGQILIVIATGGTVLADDEADSTRGNAKYIMRGVGVGGYVVLDTDAKTMKMVPASAIADGTGDASSDETSSVDEVAAYIASIEEKLGEAVADSAMNVTLSNVVAEDGTITVTLTIDGLKDGAQVDVLEGALYYDAEKLTLTTNLEDLVLTTSPDSDWETLTAPAGEGKLDFSAFTTKAKTLLNKDGKLTMDLTFTLKDGCTYGAVWMENGVSGEETDLETGAAKNTYKANGGYTVINTGSTGDTSTDTSSVESSSAESSTTPKPGDAGIIVFAVLGILAVVGVAVTVKIRK